MLMLPGDEPKTHNSQLNILRLLPPNARIGGPKTAWAQGTAAPNSLLETAGTGHSLSESGGVAHMAGGYVARRRSSTGQGGRENVGLRSVAAFQEY